MTSTTSSDRPVVDVGPDLLAQWIAEGTAVPVDVREDFEHATERLQGSIHQPLSKFDPAAVRQKVGADSRRVVFYCRTGRRSMDSAKRFASSSPNAVAYHLASGLEGWKAAGLTTERVAGAPRVDVMRQVQIVAGSLVLLGVALGAAVSPWFFALSGFVGAGLVFAGVSGWCGMAMLLGRMPWNARPSKPTGATP